MAETETAPQEQKVKRQTFNGLQAMHDKRRAEKEAERQRKLAEKMYIPDDDAPAEIEIDPNKTYVFESCVKTTAWRHETISTESKMYDTKTNRIREIRYIPVAKSIFVDEQDESLKNYPTPYLGLSRGTLSVSGADKMLVQFLLAHDAYEGNPHRLSRLPAAFRLKDKEIMEKKEEKRLKLVDDALQLLKTADAESLRSIARVVFSILDTDDRAIMNKLKNMAISNPRAILENVENPKLKRVYVIQQALDSGLIEVQPLKNNCVWNENKVQICTLDNVKDTVKSAAEIADFTYTEEGKEFFEILQQKM